jgi:hypothetical protein
MIENFVVEFDSDGFLAVRNAGSGQSETLRCASIRGAIIPPTVAEPGYYLILAEKLEQHTSGKRQLILLGEGKSDLQEDLLTQLTRDVERLKCRLIYANRNDLGFCLLLIRHLQLVAGCQLCEPLLVDDEAQGVQLIKQWLFDGAFEIRGSEETILRSELEKMTAENLSFALVPLRYLIAGFQFHRPSFNMYFETQRRRDLRKGLAGASKAAWEELDRIRRSLEEEEEFTRDFRSIQ